MSSDFDRRLWQSAGIYALFLVPSLWLLLWAGQNDASLSRHISGSWQAGFWHFPGLSPTQSRVLLDLLEALAIAGLAKLFYQGLQGVRSAQSQTPIGLSAVLKWAGICGLLLVFATPFHSSDIFGYLNRGFQQSVFQTNPYLTTIAEIPGWGQSSLLHAHWINNPCPYGFFFALLMKWLTQLAHERFITAYLLLKGLNGLLLLATTGLIFRISKQLRLGNPTLNAFWFGANPLVLLHVMGNGHNDILMVCILLLSVCGLMSPRWRWTVLPLLMLSILTKYASLLALPFIVIYLWRQRFYRDLWVGGLLSLVVVGWLGSVYVDLSHAWPWNALLENAGKPQHSLIAMLSELLYYPLKWLHWPAQVLTQQWAKGLKFLFWLGFVGFYGFRILRFASSRPEFSGLVYEITLTTTVMVALVSAKFHPWYPVMFLPLALLLPDYSRLRRFAVLLCVFQLAGFTILQNLPVLSELLLTLVPLYLALSGKTIKPEAAPAAE